MKRKIGYVLLGIMFITLLSGCTDSPDGFIDGGWVNPVEIARGDYTTLILDFKMSVGVITLEVDSSAQYLAKVTNFVSLRKGTDAEMTNAEEVEYSGIDSKTVKVQFNSADKGKQVKFAYQFLITISSNISLEFDFECGCSIEGIDFSVEFGKEAIWGVLNDETIKITSLDFVISSGEVYCELASVQFSDPYPSIVTSTEDHILHLNNLNCTTITTWDISSSTGNINLYMYDFYGYYNGGINRTHTFNIKSSTGNISVLTGLIGFKVEVITEDNSKVSVPDDLELIASTMSSKTYSSTNYSSSAIKYDLFITALAGYVEVTIPSQ